MKDLIRKLLTLKKKPKPKSKPRVATSEPLVVNKIHGCTTRKLNDWLDDILYKHHGALPEDLWDYEDDFS